ncbi:hypothetical protein KIPE111705_26805 [Kibdelosporangium persicum]|uniref:hypothetical protein n=1 Tax=Kibdelosporangium persicum TaxID=2698649 RepID=UPI001564FD44|nr:hypothetical protein [Kibdelosporangium persicum]
MSNFFGPIDPYVTLPAAALGSVAIVLLLNGVVLWGLVAAVLTGLLVAFDSWVNRRERTPPQRPVRHRHTRW